MGVVEENKLEDSGSEETNRRNAHKKFLQDITNRLQPLESTADVLLIPEDNRNGYYSVDNYMRYFWGYSIYSEDIQYIGYDLTYEDSNVRTGYSGSVDLSGNVNLSSNWDTVKHKVFKPTTKCDTGYIGIKAVPKGKKERVIDLEKRVESSSNFELFKQIKYYRKTLDLPKKPMFILTNLLSLFSCLSMLLCIFFSPKVMTETAISMAHDIRLFELLPQYQLFLSRMNSVLIYVLFALSFLCSIAALIIGEKYLREHTEIKMESGIFVVPVGIVISTILNAYLPPLMQNSPNELVYVLFKILTFTLILLRVFIVLLTLCFFVISFIRLCSNSPYKKAYKECNARKEFVSGKEYGELNKMYEEVCRTRLI